MTLWIVIAAIAALAITLTLAPLMNRTPRSASRRAHDLAVYRDQLDQLDKECALGLLPDDQREAARTEIRRRILGAGSEPVDVTPGPAGRRAVIALVCVAVMGAGSALIYRHLGAPDLPAQPFASRSGDPALQMAVNAATLAADLEAKPDVDGYVALAELYVAMRRFDRAAAAYRRAIEIGTADAEILAALGEAVANANDGIVVPEARLQFLRALSLEPREPRARFYLGLAEAQIGRNAEAVAIWRDLELSSPPSAPWLPMLRANIEQQAKAGGFDAASIAPSPPRVDLPGADNNAAVPSSPGTAAQDRAIEAMVEGLAARLRDNPGDEAGWLRLARSYRVLGEFDKAVDAAQHAIALSPKGVEPRLALAQIQLGRSKDGRLSPDFVLTMRQVMGLDPLNPMALFYMGRAEAEAGHAPQARKLWNKLLAILPPQSPEVGEVEKQLATLQPGQVRAAKQ